MGWARLTRRVNSTHLQQLGWTLKVSPWLSIKATLGEHLEEYREKLCNVHSVIYLLTSYLSSCFKIVHYSLVLVLLLLLENYWNPFHLVLVFFKNLFFSRNVVIDWLDHLLNLKAILFWRFGFFVSSILAISWISFHFFIFTWNSWDLVQLWDVERHGRSSASNILESHLTYMQINWKISGFLPKCPWILSY